MSSYNTRCVASGATITAGDPVKVLLIRQQASYEPVRLTFRDQASTQYRFSADNAHANSFWEPLGQFIDATYDDDHGAFDPVRSEQNLVRLVILFAELNNFAAQACEPARQEEAFKFQEFLDQRAPRLHQLLETKGAPWPDVSDNQLWAHVVAAWHYVEAAAEKRKLFLADQRHNLRPANFAVMQAKAHSALIERYLDSQPSGYPQTLREFLDGALARLRKELECEKAAGELVLSPAWAVHGTAFWNEFQRLTNFTLRLLPKQKIAFMESVRAGESDDVLFERIKPWLQDVLALAGFADLHLTLSPRVYVADDAENYFGRAFARFASQVNEEVAAARGERQLARRAA